MPSPSWIRGKRGVVPRTIASPALPGLGCMTDSREGRSGQRCSRPIPTRVEQAACKVVTLLRDPALIETVGSFCTLFGGQVCFQPIVDLATGEPVDFEELARFCEGTSPEEWFRLAHTRGFAFTLDAMVAACAVRTFVDHRLPGFLALNVEAVDFPAILDALPEEATHLIRSSRLVVELTERRPGPRIGWYAAGRLARIRGIRLALDDFAPRCGMLLHTLRLRPEFVKLDHSLTARLARRPDPFRPWFERLRRAGTELIAEGVEDLALVPALRDLGVRYGQGYAFGRPAPAEAWRETAWKDDLAGENPPS